MEQVIFRAINANLSLHVKKEEKYYKGEELHVIPAKLVRFEMGQHVSSDPEEIEQIRATDAYKRKRVFEITAQDREALKQPPKQKTHRGMVTSKQVGEEAGIKPEPERIALSEKGRTECPECHLVFENDFSGRRLRGHMQIHRRKEEAKKRSKES